MIRHPTMLQQERGRQNGHPSSSARINYSSSSFSLSLDDPPSQWASSSTSKKTKKPRDSGVVLKINEEPTHHPASDDITRGILVYSPSKNDLIEAQATFVDDLDENWISKGLVEILNPGFPFEEQGYGRIALKMIRFIGRLTIQWKGKESLKSTHSECRIVNAECFVLYLRRCFLPLSDAPLQNTLQTHSNSVPTPLSITPEDVFPSVSSSSLAVGSFDGLTSDGQSKWIDDNADESLSADSWIANLKSTLHTYIERGSSYPRRIPAVKIAVLDTGIDLNHPFINGALKGGRIRLAETFVNNDSTAQDCFGHGTHVANLLLNIAPDAELYVAKVAEKENIPPDHNIAKAIRWATSHNVDIITMSFGLGKHQTEMEDAVKEAAYSKSIIIFAAASNNGGNYAVTYPARYDDVICIFSTDGLGNSSSCNPTPMKHSSMHFATLGEAVPSAWPIPVTEFKGAEEGCEGMAETSCATLEKEHQQQAETSVLTRRMTGTSFATPIAAGVAACILEFSLLNGMNDDQYRMLRCRRGMQAVFFKELVEERRGLHYIHPWRLFNTIRNEETILTLMTECLD